MTHKKKAVFLDRDGTIIEDNGTIASIENVEFFSYAAEALSLLKDEYLFFIVTNQSAVGLGLITLEMAKSINSHVEGLLKDHGITVEQTYCCSHARRDNCNCIKPKPYFLHLAEKDYDIDLSKSYTIGDHPHDVLFGENVGATGLYVLTGHGTKHRADVPAGTKCFENLLEAARWIKKGDV